MSNSPKPSDFSPGAGASYISNGGWTIDLSDKDYTRLPDVDYYGKRVGCVQFERERYSSYTHHSDGTYVALFELETSWVFLSGKLRSLDPLEIY